MGKPRRDIGSSGWSSDHVNKGAEGHPERLQNLFQEAANMALVADGQGAGQARSSIDQGLRAREVARDMGRLTAMLRDLTSGSERWMRLYRPSADLAVYVDGEVERRDVVPGDVLRFIDGDDPDAPAGPSSIFFGHLEEFAEALRPVDSLPADHRVLSEVAPKMRTIRTCAALLRAEGERIRRAQAEEAARRAAAERKPLHDGVDERSGSSVRSAPVAPAAPGAIRPYKFHGARSLLDLEHARLAVASEALVYAEAQFYATVARRVHSIPELAEAVGGLPKQLLAGHAVAIGRVIANVAAHPGAAQDVASVTAGYAPDRLVRNLRQVLAQEDLLVHRPAAKGGGRDVTPGPQPSATEDPTTLRPGKGRSSRRSNGRSPRGIGF